MKHTQSILLGITICSLAIAVWGAYDTRADDHHSLVTLDEQAVPPVLRIYRLSKRGDVVSTEMHSLGDLILKPRDPAKPLNPVSDEWIPDTVLSPKRDKIAVWIWGPEEERIDVLAVKSGRLVSAVRAPRDRRIVQIAWIGSDTIRYAERHDGRRFTFKDVRVDTAPPRVIKTTTLAAGELFKNDEDAVREKAASWYRQLHISAPPGLHPRPDAPHSNDFSGHAGSVSQDGKTAALWSLQDDPETDLIVVVREKRVVGSFRVAAKDRVAQVRFVGNSIAVRFTRTRNRIVIIDSDSVKQTAELPGGIIVRLK